MNVPYRKKKGKRGTGEGVGVGESDVNRINMLPALSLPHSGVLKAELRVCAPIYQNDAMLRKGARAACLVLIRCKSSIEYMIFREGTGSAKGMAVDGLL